MPRKIAFAALAAAALLAAGCGGGGGSSSSGSGGAYGSGSGSSSSGGQAATVAIRNSSLGKILVSDGKTLYLFKKDTGKTSTCDGACAQGWPPLISSGTPKAGSGITSSMLGTSARSDGKMQVTYDGHPLYFFVEDKSAGQMKGQGIDAFGAPWYVVSPAGSAITATSGSNSSGGSGSGGSGGGYGY